MYSPVNIKLVSCFSIPVLSPFSCGKNPSVSVIRERKRWFLDFRQKVDYYIREKTKTSSNVGLRNAFSCGYEFAFETAL